MSLCLEGDSHEIRIITGVFHYYYYYYTKRPSVCLLFLLYVDFHHKPTLPILSTTSNGRQQDSIYQHEMRWLKTVLNLEEEVTRFGHRLDCGKPGESTVVSLKNTEDSDTALKSDEN